MSFETKKSYILNLDIKIDETLNKDFNGSDFISLFLYLNRCLRKSKKYKGHVFVTIAPAFFEGMEKIE